MENKAEGNKKNNTVKKNKKLIHCKFERYEVRFYMGKIHLDINYLSLIASIGLFLILIWLGHFQYAVYILFLALIIMIIADSLIGLISKTYSFVKANKKEVYRLLKEFIEFLLSDKPVP